MAMGERNSRAARRATGLAVAMVLAASQAAANDSTATLAAGGLVLTKSEDVALDREDLYVSAKEVRVHYEFRNVSGKDVSTTVAFPLPDIDLSYYSEVPITRPGSDPVNFVDFSVRVDGKPVAPTLEARALLNGADITDYLSSNKLKFSFFADGFTDALLKADPALRKELMARGIAQYDEYDNVYPQWLDRTAFHWDQVFPAGKTVIVEHRYKPVAGQFYVSKYSLAPNDDELKPYCVDNPTRAALWKRIKERSTKGGEEPDDGLLIATAVDYILTTANNWRGPIGKFRLTIDKGDPADLLTLCIDGIKKTGPTTFVLEAENYVPKADLRLLIIK
jgi:hypothetical protein